MPNWCENVFKLEGPRSVVRGLWEEVQGREGLLAALVPPPETMYEGDLGRAERAMCEEQGIPNWKDWQTKHWGTKWEVSIGGLAYREGGDVATIEGRFESAWGPPLVAYDGFLGRVEGCSIEASYWEPGFDFGGLYRDGEDERVLGVAEACGQPKEQWSGALRRLEGFYDLVAWYDEWREEQG